MSAQAPPVGMLCELTHRCPLQCPYCSNPLELHKAAEELSTDQWLSVFDQAADLGVLQVHLSGGEPTLRTDLEELVSKLAEREVYANLIASLERWPVFLLYVAAQGALALHIWHGAWSLFQSIGVNNPRFNHWRVNFATAFASIIAVGYLTVPFSIMFGIIH